MPNASQHQKSAKIDPSFLFCEFAIKKVLYSLPFRNPQWGQAGHRYSMPWVKLVASDSSGIQLQRRCRVCTKKTVWKCNKCSRPSKLVALCRKSLRDCSDNYHNFRLLWHFKQRWAINTTHDNYSCQKNCWFVIIYYNSFIDFVDFNVIFSDKIQALCRWLVFVSKNCVKINKINKKINILL